MGGKGVAFLVTLSGPKMLQDINEGCGGWRAFLRSVLWLKMDSAGSTLAFLGLAGKAGSHLFLGGGGYATGREPITPEALPVYMHLNLAVSSF